MLVSRNMLWRGVDGLIDGIVNLSAFRVAMARRLRGRRSQNGEVGTYAWALVAGVVVVLGAVALRLLTMRDFLLSLGYDRWVLPVLLALPVVGAIVIWIGAAAHEASASIVRAASAGGDADATAAVPPITPAAQFARWAALITFFSSSWSRSGLWWTFDPAVAGWQNAMQVPWIPGWGISFTIGIDGIWLSSSFC